jgi:hypothetical protein
MATAMATVIATAKATATSTATATATGEMAILSCMQFVLHADLILFAVFCRFVSGRTF